LPGDGCNLSAAGKKDDRFIFVNAIISFVEDHVIGGIPLKMQFPVCSCPGRREDGDVFDVAGQLPLVSAGSVNDDFFSFFQT